MTDKILTLSRGRGKNCKNKFWCTACETDQMHWQKVTKNKQFAGQCVCIDCVTTESVKTHKIYSLIDNDTGNMYMAPICQKCYDRSDNKIRIYLKNVAPEKQCLPWDFPDTEENFEETL